MNWDDLHPTFRHELGRRLLSVIPDASTKKNVAERVGVTTEQLGKWMGDSPPKIPVAGLLAVAEVTGADFLWLATGGEPKREDARNTVFVRRLDVALSAGPGSFVERADHLDNVPFPQVFFTERLRRNPAGMVIVDARGDSMEPTIADQDQVMIDTADTALTAAIWAFTLDDGVLVKRLQQTSTGIQVASDNPAYAPFTIDRASADGFHLIGRVVWVGRVL